jgi:hypothetical protein
VESGAKHPTSRQIIARVMELVCLSAEAQEPCVSDMPLRARNELLAAADLQPVPVHAKRTFHPH